MRAPTGIAQLVAQTENNLIKELPLRGRGACRPRCGRQASGTPKVWHGAAVTEGVNRASRARYRNFCKISDFLIYWREYEGKTYLLDTGATALFAENAKELGVDLSKVDTAFLSHAHYDHSGGFEEFFKENDKAAVYMQETSAENCFYRTEGKDKYIGIPQHLLENYKERFRPLNAVCEVEKGVWVVPHFTGGLDEMGRRAHMYRKIGEEFIADDFAHEQSVVFETGKGLVIFNSCSHVGIVNIVREVQMALGGQKVYAVVGGFHMMKLSGMDTLAIPEEEVVETAQELKGLGVEKIYTGHCTGNIAFRILKKELGEMVHALGTGETVVF